MQPHLVRWQNEVPDLVILYVADGRRVTPERVLEGMKADGARFPVAHDSSGATGDRFGVRVYPTAYLIGRDGLVAWEGVPHYDPAGVERSIKAALAARP